MHNTQCRGNELRVTDSEWREIHPLPTLHCPTCNARIEIASAMEGLYPICHGWVKATPVPGTIVRTLDFYSELPDSASLSDGGHGSHAETDSSAVEASPRIYIERIPSGESSSILKRQSELEQFEISASALLTSNYGHYFLRDEVGVYFNPEYLSRLI
jgi:hypothetical protein